MLSCRYRYSSNFFVVCHGCYRCANLQPEETLGVYFAPLVGSETDDANGEISLGGVDHSKFCDPLFYYPITTADQFSSYWGIDVSRVTYGDSTLGANRAAIVDTGTTLILLPTSVYNAFVNAAGGTTDANSGLAKFTSKPTGTFGIGFGEQCFTLTPDEYLIPEVQ